VEKLAKMRIFAGPSPFSSEPGRYPAHISEEEFVTETFKTLFASPRVKALSAVAARLAAPFVIAALLTAFTGHAFAQDAPAAPTAPAVAAPAAAEAKPVTFDLGDSSFMLVCSALVLLMTPGLAFFYGGLVRGKNVLNTLLMSYGAMAILGIAWVFVGYSLAFGGTTDGIGNYIGGLNFAFFNGVGFDNKYTDAHTIPHMLFAIFQGMFFIITPALISGSLVERMKFTTFFVYMLVWGILVYCPVAHWVWGGGWIGDMGVMDFAGGAVVHVNAGFAALGAALALGNRKGYGKRPMLPHSLPLCLLGVGLLWFGWFGFNGGSALSANGLGVLAFTNTQIGAASAMLVWMLIDQVTRKEMTALGAGTGAVAGLVGITPACGFVTPMGAVLVGAITSGVCYVMATIRAKGPVDDSLDAFAVHGVGGFTGAVLTGIFASGKITPINSLALPGLLEGGTKVFINQVWTTAAVAVYTFVMSFIICKVLQAVMGLRVSDEAEERGLDISLHGEEAYAGEGAA
jgi:Amt family ammonium transporter